jgi:hypothetical protein
MKDIPFRFCTVQKRFFQRLLFNVVKDLVRNPWKFGSLQEWNYVRTLQVHGVCAHNSRTKEQEIFINLEAMRGVEVDYIAYVVAHEYIHSVIADFFPEIRERENAKQFQVGEERVVEKLLGMKDLAIHQQEEEYEVEMELLDKFIDNAEEFEEVEQDEDDGSHPMVKKLNWKLLAAIILRLICSHIVIRSL